MGTDYSYKTLPPIITVSAILWVMWFIWKSPRKMPTKRSVAILVLGDIGRSPRMMYHAESFAAHDFETHVVGYGGSKPVPSLERLPHVHFHYLPEPPTWLRPLPFVFLAPLKIVHQFITVLVELLIGISHPPEFILVQNPPSIPTLALVWLGGRIRGSKVIIDWHNLGYSILAMKLSRNHSFVKIAKWFEGTFGRTAYAHLFVTRAMHDFLVKEWDLKGHKAVLHDRPPYHFHRASPQEVHELFIKLKPSLIHQKSLHNFLPYSSAPYSTPFTTTQSPSNIQPPPSPRSSTSPSIQINRHRASISTPPPPPYTSLHPTVPTYAHIPSPTLRSDRPALVVSSTSWTPDEDFNVLIEALQVYELRASALTSRIARRADEGSLPKLLVLITGKGPLKDKYMAEVGRLQEGWKWVRCISMWLEAEDYPILLGSADLGLCLHSSSSSLDLPMKVVDMFGCGLPVCALDFACLDELVKDGKNGLIFKDAEQLAEQLEILLTSFPSSSHLSSLRSSLKMPKHFSSPPHSPRRYIYSLHGGGGGDDSGDGDGDDGNGNGNGDGDGDGDGNGNDEHWEWGTWEENWTRVVKPLITDRIF